MNEQTETPEWVTQVKDRGQANNLRFVLDVIDPISPLAAQVLWMFQPVSRLVGLYDPVGELAQMLEDPDGTERLRHYLED